jgi:hypothetical protein
LGYSRYPRKVPWTNKNEEIGRLLVEYGLLASVPPPKTGQEAPFETTNLGMVDFQYTQFLTLSRYFFVSEKV